MTRINLIDPTELCDKHLLAEHREITRIPNCINRGRYNLKGKPDNFTLGTGHVKFFYDKLGWLQKRYLSVHSECIKRGFKVTNKWPDGLPINLLGDFTPSDEDLLLSLERIIDKLPNNPRYTAYK